ncbi:replication initiation protein [Acinetobacter nectaris]|uniref:replication initiation protein n=1 Tax=Acinetobacter nectaris TaxID=1219382 RepID=UPI001F4834F8|nr:replication initiation protein [Acinetobacter nectaris]MCF9035357.1 replication initiation protein [Acinetobacter nectaris]
MKQQNSVIKKSNNLINAKYRLTAIQQYVLHNVISQIHINDADFKKYELNIQSIAENHDIDTKNAYRYIKKAALDLNKLQIIIGDTKRGLALTWFTSVLYDSTRGSLLIDFHKDLKPYLLQLKSYFTQYEHQNIKRFKCVHSLRFYEFLKQKQNLGKGEDFYIELTIAEIRSMLCFSDTEYKKTNDMKRFVIEPALKEINEQTDLKILDTQFLKVGRSIDSIYIKAEPKLEPKAKKSKANPKLVSQQDSESTSPKKIMNFSSLIKNSNSQRSDEKQPITKESDLQKRAVEIVGQIFKSKATSSFKHSHESDFDAMKRIKAEITTEEIANHFQNKLKELGIVFNEERSEES